MTANTTPDPEDTARARKRFAAIAAGPDSEIDLAEAALWIAAESCAGLDVAGCRAGIDALADEIVDARDTHRTIGQRVASLNDALFRVRGFAGDRNDYYDPRNSFLNHVLERRRGIPISLSVLYVTVARRNGLRAEGISFPGHFLAKVLPEAGRREDEILVDAFQGRIIGEEECRVRLQSVLGAQAALARDPLRAASNKETLFRMLSNLKTIFLHTQRYEQALACCDRGLLLAPDHAHEHRDRGLVYQQLGCVRPAVTDLERYLALAPGDGAAAEIRTVLSVLRGRLPSVH